MFIGQSVKVQSRVAVGHSTSKSIGNGQREISPVPTVLRTFDAVVISEIATDKEPKLTLVYKKNAEPLNSIELQSGFLTLYDVPHRDSEDASGGIFWYIPEKPKAVAEEAKLKAFLLSNFKSETGDETPVDCAIRLLSKTKKKS